MRKLLAMACFMFAAAPLALAQDKANEEAKPAAAAPAKASAAKTAKREPSEAQKAQHDRMRACTAEATGKKGDERKKFMSACLKDKRDTQENRMALCNKEAGAKKGDERKAFMKSCLSGKS